MRRPAAVVVGLALIAVALALAVVLSSRMPGAPTQLPTPTPANALVALVRAGPTTYFIGPDGKPSGFDADLLHLFAHEHGLPLRYVVAQSPGQMIDNVAAGVAHIGAGGLFRPAPTDPPSPGFTSVPAPGEPLPLWTAGYYAVEPVVIHNSDGYRPSSWKDLQGEMVVYLDATGLEPQIATVRAAHPEIRWAPSPAASAEALIAQVSDGGANYAIVASNEAAVSRNIYLGYDVAFAAGGRRELAWTVAPTFPKLRADIDRFFAKIKRDGTLARLTERYFTFAREMPRIDAEVFQERIRTLLPQYRALFHEAQDASGIEWRLLAAIAYQESHWDPDATSETGVRGLMQLTEDTARRLGVIDRLDPKTTVRAAARYLRDLKRKIPERIPEPDRTWLALAAFNIGLGHLEDARVLAQKQKLNPDAWSDVKKTLPLLALPEYHEQAKLGYARGGMPVAFVDRVRAYYDVLLAQQRPHQSRLRASTDESPAAEQSGNSR